MSDQTVIDTSTAAPVIDAPPSEAVLEAQLSDIFDRNMVNNGADRGDDGKFTSPNAEAAVADVSAATIDPSSTVEAEGEGSAAPNAPAEVPLPPNWRGLDETWAKIPAELRQTIAEHEQGLHETLSHQGRALSEVKPVQDVLKHFAPAYEGKIAPHQAMATLFQAHAELEANPTAKLLQLADSYGVRQQLAQMIGGAQQGQQPANQVSLLLNEIAGLKRQIATGTSPATVERIVSERLAANQEETASIAEVDRLSKDKPFYSDVEVSLPTFINLAWEKLGPTAAKAAVFDLAYDMAVHADPALRTKSGAAKAAPVTDAKKVDAARKANAVNVTSTSSGRLPADNRPLEALLGDIYDKHQTA